MVWCVVNSTETKHSFRCYGLSLSEKRWCLRFSKCAWKSLMSVNILYSRFLLAILSRMCEYWYLSKHIWRTPQTPHMHSHTHTNFCYQHKSHDIGCVKRRRNSSSKHNKSNSTCIIWMWIRSREIPRHWKNERWKRAEKRKKPSDCARRCFIIWYDTFIIIMKCTIFISILPIKIESVR